MKLKPALFQPLMAQLAHLELKTHTRRDHKLGDVGDVLWARECFAITMNIDQQDDWPGRNHIRIGDSGYIYIWRGDGEWEWCDDDGFSTERSYWKSSMFMPRSACRTYLEILDVWQEPLGHITNMDAMAEGFMSVVVDSRDLFLAYYENICKKNKKPFDLDQVVWVHRFKKVPEPVISLQKQLF